MGSRARPSERTLVCLVQALQGMRLVVELRQDTIVRGMLDSADEEMNLVMTNVTFTPLQGEQKHMDWLYVKGHHIRCFLTANLGRWPLLTLFSKKTPLLLNQCLMPLMGYLIYDGWCCRFVHIPSKVDPTRIVEQNRRRIAQVMLVHNREAKKLLAETRSKGDQGYADEIEAEFLE